MRTEMLATVEQISPSILGSGNEETARISKIGQLFTADWKTRLLLAGKMWRLSVGTVSGDSGVTRVTGGGAGTLIDLDEPEMAVSVTAGYFLIPIEVMVSAVLDQDANAELGEILVCMDRTYAIPEGTTTIATMYNQLDGGPTFPGIAAHTHVGTALSNPVNEEILAIETVSSSEFVSNGTATNLTNGLVTQLKLHYEPEVPTIVAGPCTLTVYWGGTDPVTALASLVVAVVPSTWFPVS